MQDVIASRPKSDVFGLALTSDEEALLTRRAELPAELDRLNAVQRRHSTGWGGLWIGYPEGEGSKSVATINVALTHESEEIRQELIELLLTT